MALPTTNLTLHCRADRTDQLFTTKNGGGSGIHTGTPADGNTVQVWDDEGDGITDVCLANGNNPEYRSTTPLMLHSCLDFNGGTPDSFGTYTQDGSVFTPKSPSSFISSSAFTFAIVFYPETVGAAETNAYDNDALFGNLGPWFGLNLRDNAGTYEVLGTNNDGGGHDVVSLAGGDPSRTWIAIYRHGGGNLDLTVIDDTGSETSASPVASGNTGNLSNYIYVGRSLNASSVYDGRIGEFAIYNAQLTGTDLADLKQHFIDRWLNIPQVVTLPLISSGATLYPPSVSAYQNIVTASIASTATLYPPTMAGVGLVVGGLTNVPVLYPPTIGFVGTATVGLPHIASTALLYPPFVEASWVNEPTEIFNAYQDLRDRNIGIIWIEAYLPD